MYLLRRIRSVIERATSGSYYQSGLVPVCRHVGIFQILWTGVCRVETQIFHPSDEDLSLGTPSAETPAMNIQKLVDRFSLRAHEQTSIPGCVNSADQRRESLRGCGKRPCFWRKA
jgi:hypothetical protein